MFEAISAKPVHKFQFWLLTKIQLVTGTTCLFFLCMSLDGLLNLSATTANLSHA